VLRENPTFENHPLPDLGLRWWGRFVDGVVIGLPLSLIARIAIHDPVARVPSVIVALLIYDGLCVSIWGQTLGKRVARTRVVPVRPGALRPSVAQAFVRAAMLALPSLLFLLPRPAGGIFFLVGWAFIVFPMLRQRQRRGSPDLLARTIVVDARTYPEAVPDATP
jgi:uncharacterized RDD family membrane protein YckC